MEGPDRNDKREGHAESNPPRLTRAPVLASVGTSVSAGWPLHCRTQKARRAAAHHRRALYCGSSSVSRPGGGGQ